MLDNISATNISPVDYERTFIKIMTSSDINIIKAIANFVHECEITFKQHSNLLTPNHLSVNLHLDVLLVFFSFFFLWGVVVCECVCESERVCSMYVALNPNFGYSCAV